jgi:hypothetical protein
VYQIERLRLQDQVRRRVPANLSATARLQRALSSSIAQTAGAVLVKARAGPLAGLASRARPVTGRPHHSVRTAAARVVNQVPPAML